MFRSVLGFAVAIIALLLITVLDQSYSLMSLDLCKTRSQAPLLIEVRCAVSRHHVRSGFSAYYTRSIFSTQEPARFPKGVCAEGGSLRCLCSPDLVYFAK